MNRPDFDRYLLALKAWAENTLGWRRVKARSPMVAPHTFTVTGYKDGMAQHFEYSPADPEDPKMPDGSEWR